MHEQLPEAVTRAEREWLRAHVLGTTRTRAAAQALDPRQQGEFDALLARRAAGEPLAYILGEWEFWSLPLKITPDVLVPRADTETLVEWALQLAPPQARVLDLGTGSGAIGLALARERPQASVVAIDTSTAALEVAQHNAQRLGIANVEFLHTDFRAALDDGERYELVVSNPPYIAENDPHLADLQYEPRIALTAGADGLDQLRVIVANAPAALEERGWLLVEHGYDQGAAVRGLFERAGFLQVQTRRDLGGNERVTGGRRA
ncbi:MAG TPA: peptide chain release factor N(5)-glutamine methyltransferase [Nevskiaceae bacterium]|nr:peptide chain release factor N(5)-glutamine methyltransferase [Nevskiaceae bacterium]